MSGKCRACLAEDVELPHPNWLLCTYCLDLEMLRQKKAQAPTKRVFILIPIWEGLRDAFDRLLFVER